MKRDSLPIGGMFSGLGEHPIGVDDLIALRARLIEQVDYFDYLPAKVFVLGEHFICKRAGDFYPEMIREMCRDAAPHITINAQQCPDQALEHRLRIAPFSGYKANCLNLERVQRVSRELTKCVVGRVGNVAHKRCPRYDVADRAGR